MKTNKKVKKTRKKGSSIIEFLVVIPVFMMMIWGIVQVMLFILATNTLNEAAMESARIAAQNLRGYDGSLVSFSGKDDLKKVLVDKSTAVTKFNGFILLDKTAEGGSATVPVDVKATRNDCISYIKSKPDRSICAWTEDSSGDGHKQVGVYIAAKFLVTGSLIPSLKDITQLKGFGMAQLDLSNRFQYIE